MAGPLTCLTSAQTAEYASASIARLSSQWSLDAISPLLGAVGVLRVYGLHHVLLHAPFWSHAVIPGVARARRHPHGQY